MSHPGYRESLYTDSTVPSTVWGPGTLAGRAILALGEATLKGLDRIIDRESRAIQKRFEVIRGSVPHLTIDMYSDLVELSRPDLYPQYILERAADIVFHQIDLGYSAAVSLSVSQLSLAEARLVVFRMFTSRDLDLSDDEHQVGEKTPRKALDLLAMLIQVRPEMTSLCFEVVDYLIQDPHICVLCREHPVIRIHAEESLKIPPICRTPLSELQMRFSRDNMYRWKNWKLLESAGHPAEGRLLHLNAVLLAAVREELCNTPDFFDAAVDLFDFLRYSKVPELRRIATDLLITCISITHASWEPLRHAVLVTSRPEKSSPRYELDTPKIISPPSPGEDPREKEVLEINPNLREFIRYATMGKLCML